MYLANASIIKENAGAPHACRAKPPSPTPNAMASVLLHLGWAGTKVGVSSLTAHVKASLPPQLAAFGEFSIVEPSCALKTLSKLRDINLPTSPWACPFARPTPSTGPCPSSCQPTNDDDNSPLVVYVEMVPGSTRGHLGSSTKKCAAQKWRAERGWPVCWDLCLSAAATPP